MPVVNGCTLPDDLLYDVENQLWYRERPDGLVDVGMTAVAVAMVGGRIVAITPKRAGRRVDTGQTCAVRIRQVRGAGEGVVRRRDRREQRDAARSSGCRQRRP